MEFVQSTFESFFNRPTRDRWSGPACSNRTSSTRRRIWRDRPVVPHDAASSGRPLKERLHPVKTLVRNGSGEGSFGMEGTVIEIAGSFEQLARQARDAKQLFEQIALKYPDAD